MTDDAVILRAFFEGRELARIDRQSVPVEKRVVAVISTPHPTLSLRDSRGTEWVYDLSSCLRGEARHLHFSFSVGSTFGAQADCVLWNSEHLPDDAFHKGEADGIRFQPCYLPECPGDPAELVGRGLFFRGLHVSGYVTPGNVSLLCVCDSCRKSFRVQSFHAGFADLAYFYCDKAPHTLVASAHLPDAPPLLVEADEGAISRFESQLPPCEKCGGAFLYYNPLRCPHCLAPYIDFERYPKLRETEYYGNHLYGDTVQRFEPPADQPASHSARPSPARTPSSGRLGSAISRVARWLGAD